MDYLPYIILDFFVKACCLKIFIGRSVSKNWTICYQKVPLCCLALANYGVFNLSVISSPFSIIGSDRRANTCGSTTTRITYCRLLTLLELLLVYMI